MKLSLHGAMDDVMMAAVALFWVLLMESEFGHLA